MGKTRNFQKKQEGRKRKLEKEDEKKRLIEEEKEKEAIKYWSIGAKDNTKKEEEEEKRKERIMKRAQIKKLYEEEMGEDN